MSSAPCACASSAPMIVEGVLVCAVCRRAPVIALAPGTEPDAEVSTYRLPVDAKGAAAFNRACRSGAVRGAEKRGRAWVCTVAAWRARERMTPNVPARAPAKSRSATVPDADADVLSELGLARAAGTAAK